MLPLARVTPDVARRVRSEDWHSPSQAAEEGAAHREHQGDARGGVPASAWDARSCPHRAGLAPVLRERSEARPL